MQRTSWAAGKVLAWSGVWIQRHLESETLCSWSCEGHTTEGWFETRRTSLQGKSETVYTQDFGFHEEANQVSRKMGYIRRNPHSRWNSPVLTVPKPKLSNEFRMTVNTRYPNSQLVAIVGCLPILALILQHLKLASVFANLDAFNGFNSHLTFQAGCNQWTVYYSKAFWLGSTTYWST